ncbi:MAG: hypothetical protein WC745_03730 [Patescibacteria group bacterium]|jgi:hypothetical protein
MTHEQQPDNQLENPEKIDLTKLNFQELEAIFNKASELAENTFTEKENGFVNIQRDGIIIMEAEGKWRITRQRPWPKFFETYIMQNATPVFTEGSKNKQELMSAIREAIEQSGNRIIE